MIRLDLSLFRIVRVGIGREMVRLLVGAEGGKGERPAEARMPSYEKFSSACNFSHVNLLKPINITCVSYP
jgi:hypothetical protein